MLSQFLYISGRAFAVNRRFRPLFQNLTLSEKATNDDCIGRKASGGEILLAGLPK